MSNSWQLQCPNSCALKIWIHLFIDPLIAVIVIPKGRLKRKRKVANNFPVLLHCMVFHIYIVVERMISESSSNNIINSRILNSILHYKWTRIVNLFHFQSVQCKLGQVGICDWEWSGLLRRKKEKNK